jgi:hypothetical protein
MDSVAVRTPTVVGLNVTLMVQLKPGAKVVPQVPPAVNAGRTNTPAVVGRIGVIVMFMAVSGTVPVLDSVSVCGALVVSMVWGGKAVGVDRLKAGGTMVPLIATTCGAPVPAFTVSVATFRTGAAAVGRKVTLIEQVPLTATVAQPVFVWLNCEESAPLSVIPLPASLRGTLPKLVTTTG